MAQLHNELRRQTEILRAIKDALAITDAEVNVERLGETLTPSINIWELPEWAVLRDESLLCEATAQGAVAGELSAVGISNPTGSKAVAVVEAIRYRSGAPARVRMAYGIAALTDATLGPAGFFNRDPRLTPGTATPGQGAVTPVRFVFGSDTSFANFLTTTIEDASALIANQDYDAMCPPVVVPPGFSFVAISDTANTLLAVTIRARARTAYPAEL